jgi:WD40 repeat protein
MMLSSSLTLIAALALLPQQDARSAAPVPTKARPGIDLYGDEVPEGALARLGSKRWCRRDILYSVAWRPDGKAIAAGTAAADGTSEIVVWNADGHLVAQFPGQAHVVRSVCWSSDGRKLVSTGGDGGIRICDVAAKTSRALRPTGNFDSALFLRDGRTVVVVDGPDLLLLDPEDGRERRRLPTPSRGGGPLAASPDGKLVASCGSDEKVRLWDAVGWKELRSLELGADRGLGLAFSPDSRTIACGTFHGAIRGWDVASGKKLFRHQLHDEACRALAFTPDGKALVLAADTVRVWNVVSRKEVRQMDHGAQVMNAAVSPDGRTIASIGGHGALRLWDRADGTEVVKDGRHSNAIHSIAISLDGKLVSTACSGNPVRLWEASSGRLLLSLPDTSRAHQAAFLPRSRTLIVASNERHLEFWDIDRGESVRTLRHKDCLPCPFVVTRDGRTLAGSSTDGQVRLFDVATGQVQKRTFPAQGDFLGSTIKLVGEEFAFSGDGTLLASRGGAADGLTVWETATGKDRAHILTSGFPTAFSPDGRLLAVRSDAGVELYETEKGQLFSKLPCPGRVKAVVFSPDGKALAVAGRHGVVVLWEVASGKERCRCNGHEGPVECLAFAQDCRRIASGSADLTALVWDLASQKSSSKDLKSLWRTIRGIDAVEAHGALWALVEQPRATEFLGRQMTAVRPVAREKVLALISDLDSDSFVAREAAQAALVRLRDAALPVVQEVRKDRSLGPERRQRLERLAAQMEGWQADLRAVEVLERIGTREAREVLRQWADGMPQARLTREAKAALRRCSMAD